MASVSNRQETIRAILRFFYFHDNDDLLALKEEMDKLHPVKSEQTIIKIRSQKVADFLNRE